VHYALNVNNMKMLEEGESRILTGLCIEKSLMEKKDSNGNNRYAVSIENHPRTLYVGEWCKFETGDTLQVTLTGKKFNDKIYENVGKIINTTAAYNKELVRKETAILNAKKNFQEETGIQLF